MRESTVHAKEQPFVSELIRDADPQDLRQSDVALHGTNLGGGLPVVGDMCMSSALHADGTPWAGATNRDGEATDRMRYRKCVTEYSDLATSSELLYLVLSCEEGGRWEPDVHSLVKDPVETKIALLHPLLRISTALAFTRRWCSVLSIGAQTVAIDCIMNQRSHVLAYGVILHLEKILPLADITPEPSCMA